MKLTELKINEYIELLGSDAPAPGGGSAAALSAAQGAALTNMVTALTVGKAKYAEFNDLNEDVKVKSQKLQEQFVQFIDKDTEAFNEVSAVFAMPKATDEDKAARKEAMQVALKGAAKVPYEVMEACAEMIKLTASLVGKSNTNAASDLVVAALNLKSAIQGAYLNVLINLSGIKDEAFNNEYKEKANKLLSEVLPIADKVYADITVTL